MSAPCKHQSITPGCNVCAIAAKDPRYARLFFDAPPPRAPARAPDAAPCRHLGGATGELVACPSCKGAVQLKTFACAVHGSCTPAKRAPGTACCVGCGQYEPAPDYATSHSRAAPRSFPVRHCIYHVCPLSSGAAAWRRCCTMLAARAEMFTGRRIDAAADDQTTEPADVVREALPDFEVIEFANDPRLREALTLPVMLSRLDLADPEAAVFFGHAKGVTRPENKGVTCHPWAWLLHEILLDYWPLVEGSLSASPITGAFKKVGRGFAGSPSAWHYSGAFFWARAPALRGRRVERKWFGAESSPGAWFRPEEAGCLFHEGRVPALDLYSMSYFHNVLTEYQWWKQQHERERTGRDRQVLASPV